MGIQEATVRSTRRTAKHRRAAAMGIQLLAVRRPLMPRGRAKRCGMIRVRPVSGPGGC